jgi:GTPase SAR1 family protein
MTEYRAEGTTGIVTANEIEVSIKFKGVGRLINGGDESYPMEKIKAVGFKVPTLLVGGHIQFGVLDAHGRAEANSTNSGFIFGSMEHMVQFDKKSLKDFTALKEFVEQQIEKHKSGNSSKQPSQLNVADELEKLARLKESGVLTDDEFQMQKKRLLG